MRLLALETSGMSGSVATLASGGKPQVVRLPATALSARGLAPAVRDAVRLAGWKANDVDVVAVTVGPGSFTGLRIGVTTAKTLAYAWKADLVAVDTLDVLARQAPSTGDVLHAVLDAHRQELFTADFRRDAAGSWIRNGESRLITVEAWLAALRPGDAVIGPVLGRLSARLPDSIVVASSDACEPHAGTVAELAAEAYAAGRRDDIWQIIPWYGRLAAAEEKRLGITS
jgi:tRNA threonylcarbamoyladenosine biosynthesis protein TsaB